MAQAAEWLDRRTMADYISRRVDELPRLLKRRLIPQPYFPFGPRSPRWRRSEVDAMFAGRTVTVMPARLNADETFDRITNKILSRHRRL